MSTDTSGTTSTSGTTTATTPSTGMTGHRAARDGGDVLVVERSYRAAVADVWAACTDPERMQRWIGTWSGDPTSGEISFSMTAEGEDAAVEVWVVEACEPPHRFAVRSRTPQPFAEDGAGGSVPWVITLELREADGVTHLAFTQQVPHADVAASVGPGWEYYLDRLSASLEAAPVEAVAWADYEQGAAYYRSLFSAPAGAATRAT